jgi:hypothetical protein
MHGDAECPVAGVVWFDIILGVWWISNGGFFSCINLLMSIRLNN